MKKKYVLQLEVYEGSYRDICIVDEYADAVEVMLNNIGANRKCGLKSKHRISEVLIEVDERE